jgi:hypothetical protein
MAFSFARKLRTAIRFDSIRHHFGAHREFDGHDFVGLAGRRLNKGIPFPDTARWRLENDHSSPNGPSKFPVLT